MKNIYRIAREIELVITDVDGVLSDGKIVYDADGREIKRFDARDGMMIVGLRHQGIKVAILTGRDSRVVDHRAEELGISIVRQKAIDKLAALDSVLEEAGTSAGRACFIGDDVNDVAVMRKVGLGFAPYDATPDAKAAADFVTRAAGGEGVVREVGEIILEAKGLRDQWLKRYNL